MCSTYPDLPWLGMMDLVDGPARVVAEASDAAGVTLVEFAMDGAVVALDRDAPYELALPATGSAPVVVRARAYDAAHNAGEATVTLVPAATPRRHSAWSCCSGS